MQPYVIWISFCSWAVATGWILSCFKQLNLIGYGVSLAIFIFWFTRVKLNGDTGTRPTARLNFGRLIKRFSRPLTLIYLLCLLGALIGGALHAPTNFDALCYRIPRILHWISQGQWHWIGGWNARLDWSSMGFEWLMLPQIIFLRTDRLLFLINVASYALLPGLIYASFTGLGISRRVAWYWMWILPTGYGFVLQAGSIGNDSYATVFFLSATTFALRAVRRSNYSDAVISVLSAALLTGTKASNLPLLLPLLLVMVPMFGILLKKPIITLEVMAVAVLISFLPLAYFNTVHTGGWNGDPHNLEKLQLDNPVAGLAGNSIQLFIGSFSPPVIPMAKILSLKLAELATCEPLLSIKQNFPRLGLTIGELPIEEMAGVGLGVTLVFCASLLAGIFERQREITSKHALYFGLLCWASFLLLISKLGSDGIARYTVIYAAGMVLPVLALSSQRQLIDKEWWRVTALICQLMVLPVLLLNPARPLLPVQSLLSLARYLGMHSQLINRAEKVYSVYGNRSDSLKTVRDHLPMGVRVIGFAGTSDEPEYSFWKPMGERKVVDLKSNPENMQPPRGIDCIVGSEWGFNDRYHLTSEDYASKIGWKIAWRGSVAVNAGRDPATWYVIESPATK